MSRQVTAKDLNLDDKDEFADVAPIGKGPQQDSLETVFKGGPQKGDVIGKEVVEKEVEEAKKRQQKAEEDREAEELEKIEGKKDEPEEEEVDEKTKATYEKRVKDAQRKMHDAATKSSKLERIVGDLEKRLKEASEAAPIQKTPGESPFEVRRQKVADDFTTQVAAMSVPIAPQDREDPEYDAKFKKYEEQVKEYNAKVGRLWVDTQDKIAEIRYEEKRQDEEDRKTVIAAIETAIVEAGSPLVDDDGEIPKWVMDLFWSQSNLIPKSLSVEDKIKKTVEACKTIVEGMRAKVRERTKKEKETQENLEVLGRGSRVTTKKEPEAPKTFAEIQRAVREKRRLRRNP